VWISALPEHAPLVRAIARCAYENGARFVDVDYTDQHVRRARIQHADDETLGWTPPWLLAKLDYLAEQHSAQVHIVGDPEPELLADLDGTRVGKTRMRELAERYVKATSQRLINWTIVAFPNEGWAQSVFGEPDVERLWDAVASATRLDESDPVEAWRRHIEKLVERGTLLNERRFDCIRFRGPGTDLTVGLTPRSTGALRSKRPWTAAATSSTCRRKRFLRPRIAAARKGPCARRSRWHSPATSSATSRCASRAAGWSR